MNTVAANSNSCSASFHLSTTLNPGRCSLNISENLDSNVQNNPDPISNNQLQIITSYVEERDSFPAEPFEDNNLPIIEHIDLTDQRSDQDIEASEANVIERWVDGDSMLSLRSFFLSAFNEAELSFRHDLLPPDLLFHDTSQNDSKINKCDFNKLLEIVCEEDDSDPDEVCPICIDKYMKNDVMSKLPCNHLFHKECTKKWLISHNACPICRRMV